MSQYKIAFIGLGNMGGPMAANLVKAHCEVYGFDISATSCKAAEANGVTIAGSIEKAVDQAQVVITMLPAGNHVIAVLNQIISAAPKGTLVIDCSTIDVNNARAAHSLATRHGLQFVDAPVSGGVGGAAAGTLTFMVGGDEHSLRLTEKILSFMGRKIVHCGGPGAGQAAKICNNMILGISMIGVCEAFALGEKLGLESQALFDVASTSSGQCWALTSYCPVPGPVPTSPANNDYQPGFAAALMLKDLRLSQDAARSADVVTELGAVATRLYERFNESGHAGSDFSAIIQAVRNKSGRVAS